MIENLHQKYLQSNQVVSTDSRNIPEGCMFFALKGESFDGNIYAEEAIKKGALTAIIDNPAYEGENTILVPDVLTSLQQLANYHRKNSRFKVLGLTGSNGKTTTKELILKVLSQKYRCSATKGNLNNHIGVPLTILATPPNTEILIVEMGANHQGEIAKLCKIAEPDTGLITNIGRAHLEGFGGYKGVIKAKTELYNYLQENNKTTYVNTNDKLLNEISKDFKNVIDYGSNTSDCFLESLAYDSTLSLEVNIAGTSYPFSTHLFGKYNADNILAAVCIGYHFNISPEKIKNAVESYLPENNRSQVKKTATNTLILDSYNANPSSMFSALTSFHELESTNKVVILGEMKELGKESPIEHKKIVELVYNLDLDDFFFVGNEFSNINTKIENHYLTTDELINKLKKKPLKNSVIFIKGSRTNKLETIIDYL